MNNNITIESLKRKFYLQSCFDRYCEYLQHRNFGNVEGDRLNRALDIALTDGDGKKNYGFFFGRDYDSDEKEYGTYLCHNINISESQIWASVEEFFDILNNEAIGELEGLRKHIYSLLEFIKTDRPKNPDETKQMSEDTIIRLIVKHFWRENPIEEIKRDFVFPIHYAKEAKLMFLDSKGVLKEDSADRRKKRQRVVIPFSKANEVLDRATYDSLISITKDRLIDKGLQEDFKQVISYLKAIKKIRNNQAHHINNTVTVGANKVFEFCLFVYLHLVLTLRKTLILRGKGEYHQQEPAKFRVYIDAPNPSLDVKLYKLVGDNEIEIAYDKEKSDSKKLVFDVEYYVNYKLAVSDQREIKTEFVYNSLSPHAYIHAMGEPEIRHCAEDSTSDNTVLFEDLLKEMSRTGDNIEDIKETSRAILKKQGEQVEILKKNREDRIKREEEEAARKKAEEEEAAKKKAEEDKKAKRIAEEEEEAKKIAEEARKKVEEEAAGRKRRCRLRILSGVIGILLMAAIAVFVRCYVTDNSLLWLQHKIAITFIVSVLVALFLSSIIGCYRLYSIKSNKKKYVPVVLVIILALLIGGSYYQIPHKTAQDFVKNYNFNIHSYDYNVKAVEYIERLKEEKPEDGIIMAQLTNYYLNYSDCIEKAIHVSKPLENVEKYDYLSEWPALVAFQIGDYENTLRIIENYNKCYNRSTVTMNTLYGAMLTFGKGVEQDFVKGINILIESYKSDDNLAQYFLGHAMSNDITIWDYAKTNILNADIKDAICLYRMASNSIMNASLELANIYSDLGMNDSALFYYEKVLERTSKQDLCNEALYRKGLIEDMDSLKGYNSCLSTAISHGYNPAISYYASKQKDNIISINAYKKMGVYKGYRYLAPIAFRYLDEGAKVKSTAKEKYRENAKLALLECRPDGKFDDNFILGLEFLLGLNSEHKVDSVKGMEYMKQSAQQGCLFADLICEFSYQNDLISNGSPFILVNRLKKISESIPLAHVLLSYLYQKGGLYEAAKYQADYAMRKGYPGGAIMYANLAGKDGSHRNLVDEIKEGKKETSILLPQLERVLRMCKQKKGIWQSAALIDFEYNQEINIFGEKEIPAPIFSFWTDIAMGNHWLDTCFFLLTMATDENDMFKFIDFILSEVDETIPIDHSKFLTYCINKLSIEHKERLLKAYGKNSFKRKLISTSISPIDTEVKIDFKSDIWRLKKLGIKDVITEFSSNFFIMPQYLY